MQKLPLEEFTITKSQVECYKIRHPSGHYVADITLDIGHNSKRQRIMSVLRTFHYDQIKANASASHEQVEHTIKVIDGFNKRLPN